MNKKVYSQVFKSLLQRIFKTKKDIPSQSPEPEVTIYLFKCKEFANEIKFELWINAKRTNYLISLNETKKLLSTYDYMNLIMNSESIFTVKNNILYNIIKKKKQPPKEMKLQGFSPNFFEPEK